MIKNDTQKLNQDDWLLKEIEREKRVSAWDFDEGKRIREEHEENCDVKEGAQMHEYYHKRRRGPSLKDEENDQSWGAWLMIDTVALIFLFILNFFVPVSSFAGVSFMFFMLSVGMIMFAAAKKTPTASYLRSALFIALFIEIIGLIMNNYRYLRFYLWRLF